MSYVSQRADNNTNTVHRLRWQSAIPPRMSIPNRPTAAEMLNSRYSYNVLQKAFPWKKLVRAGVIPIFMGNGPIEVLMVHQRAEEQRLKGGRTKHLPVRAGFPKGQQEDCDKSALETALRELKEETGIDVHDARLAARIVVSTIIIPRMGRGIDELLIYFIVIIGCKPQISICEHELSGYSWINIASSLKNEYTTTWATAKILDHMRLINFWGPIKSIAP